MSDEISSGYLSKENVFNRQPVLPPDFKPLQPLPDDEFQVLRAKLIREGTVPTVIELPPHGEDLKPFLRDQLNALGYDQPRFVRRVVSKERLAKTIMYGTDRDSTSQLDYHRGNDGERLAMIENGLNPLSDGGVVHILQI